MAFEEQGMWRLQGRKEDVPDIQPLILNSLPPTDVLIAKFIPLLIGDVELSIVGKFTWLNVSDMNLSGFQSVE